ncbi:MAG TPA: dihydrofolate reductase family protein [Nakamurella sp.]|jgi:5-amino-6-(5-phosphoribosylamino)uracil reductase
MADRPYTLLSCSMSIDGYLGGATDARMLMSNDADFDRVDAVRAECDAILVGAATIRSDDPRLLIRDPERQRARVLAGRPPQPAKVTLTARGDLDRRSQFFTAGSAERLVYCTTAAVSRARDRIGHAATVVDGGEPVDLAWMTRDLHRRGIDRLMVEGGGRLHTQFLTAGLADELQLVVAPFFVGDSRAPRFVTDGVFPWNPDRRATVAEVRQIGDVVLIRYALSARCPAD